MFLLYARQEQNAGIFKEAPVVIWRPTRHYVSPAITQFNLALHIGEPCRLLNQFSPHATGHLQPGQVTAASVAQEVNRTLGQCRQTFQEQILDKIAMLSGARTSQMLVPIMQGAIGVTTPPNHQDN